MNTTHIAIPVPTSLFLELVDFLKEQGSDRDPVVAVATAIDYWLENASWKQDDLMPEIRQQDQGYRWKQLFLPHGTRIRMKYKGQLHYAKVEGDEFVYLEKSMSPSEFAKQVAGGIARNAWRDLEIRRPSDDEWFLADTLRARIDSVQKEIDTLTTQ